MLTLIFVILMFSVFGKLLLFSIKAAGDHQDRIYHRAAAAGPDRHGAGGPDVRRFDPGGDHRGGVAVCVQGVMEKEKVNIEVRVI